MTRAPTIRRTWTRAQVPQWQVAAKCRNIDRVDKDVYGGGEGDGAVQVFRDISKPAGEARKVADTSRAATLLGFAPKIGLSEGIARTLAWYRANRRAAVTRASG